MRNKTTLNNFEEHPYRDTINNLGIAQFDLAYSLSIPQSRLSQMLRGIQPMPDKIENEIHEILESLKEPAPKPKPAKNKKIRAIKKG